MYEGASCGDPFRLYRDRDLTLSYHLLLCFLKPTLESIIRTLQNARALITIVPGSTIDPC